MFCAVVMLDDGVREYSAVLAGVGYERSWRVATRGIIVTVLLWAGWQNRDAMHSWADRYQAAIPLDLPSSTWIRAPRQTQPRIAELVGQVADCKQLVSYPGMYSLNLWADIPPPTGFNATLWTDLLDKNEQTAIVEQLRSADDPVCFVISEFGDRWRRGQRGGPLERYLSDFVPRWRGLGYVVLVRPQQ